jgi:zinc-ribbon domain
MNCTHCNEPLIPGASFCRNCGTPVSPAFPPPATTNNMQANQREIGDSPTSLPPSWQSQQPAPVQPQYIPPQAYQPTVAVSPNAGSMPRAGAPYASPPLPTRRRKNRFMQILLISLAALLIIILLLVAGWFVVLRPYLHGQAQNEIDGAFSNAITQINPTQGLIVIASGAPVVITESSANSFIASNTSSGPIQQMHMTITPAGLKIEFQTYGFTSTITAVPQVVNGQLVITNVTVQGIASLVMSPDELTTTLNAHLQDISSALQNSFSSVILKEGEMDIIRH